MNDQLQQALTTAISKASGAVEAGAGFLASELPDVIRQLLLWKMAQACLMFLLCAAVILAFAVVLAKGIKVWAVYEKGYRLYRLNSNNEEEREGARIVDELEHPCIAYACASIGFGVAALVSCFAILEYAATALQIWLSPKIYLIEYAARLAGGK